MALAIGARIGPYEVTGALGAGGMGEVYRATDPTLKRTVALKVLPASVAGEADRIARFQREAEVLAALNHPNIAGVFGLESSGNVRALVMEFVDGPTLADLLDAGGASASLAGASAKAGVPHGLKIEDALAIARQIAEALEAAHERGIVHRDLKPANIKVKDDGTVKVLDFGLAKAMDPEGAIATADAMHSPTMTARATAMGTILGTAAYMAPEQAKGRSVDKRADIWAFGVVVYEMLTGQRAFPGDDITETLAAVIRDTPDFAKLPAATPRRLRQLVERCRHLHGVGS
jgi:eukaryotic-like serine/threonine-protein kinase